MTSPSSRKSSYYCVRRADDVLIIYYCGNAYLASTILADIHMIILKVEA